MKTNAYTNGVMGITYLARTVNREIGSYQSHHINESFNFTVELSNGSIKMSLEIAQDYETRPSSVTFDRFELVANTFCKT